MFDIITIGSAVRDIFLLSKEFQILRSSTDPKTEYECVELGAKVEVEECVLSTGGGATNAAVTFANLGFSTTAVAKVGDDEPGHAVLSDLMSYKVDGSFVKVIKKGRTGYSTLLTAPNGERTALVYRGVSADFAQTDIPWKQLSAKWLYITSLSGNIDLLAKLITEAKKKGAKIAVNPGSGELEKGAQLRQILEGADVILLNLEEAQQLSGSNSKDGKELAQMLVKRESVVVVTDSSRGAYAAQGKIKYYAKNRNVKSISRTGAGDAFGSGFVAALMKDMSVEDALKVGTLNAESVIQHIGAKKGIITKWPTKKDLDEIRVFATK